jgi:OOP family OmpA-OmpF porin
MKKLLITILAASSSTIIAAQAFAAEVNPVYFNLNTGIATGYSFTNNAGSDKPSGAAHNNYSLGANLGVNFNQYLGLEAGYNQLWLSKNPTNSSGEIGVEDIAVKGTLPLGDIFSLYGRAGLGGYQNVGAGSGGNFAHNLGILYGAGAQWALDKNWALRVEDWSVSGLGQNIIQFGAQLSF